MDGGKNGLLSLPCLYVGIPLSLSTIVPPRMTATMYTSWVLLASYGLAVRLSWDSKYLKIHDDHGHSCQPRTSPFSAIWQRLKYKYAYAACLSTS